MLHASSPCREESMHYGNPRCAPRRALCPPRPVPPRPASSPPSYHTWQPPPLQPLPVPPLPQCAPQLPPPVPWRKPGGLLPAAAWLRHQPGQPLLPASSREPPAAPGCCPAASCCTQAGQPEGERQRAGRAGRAGQARQAGQGQLLGIINGFATSKVWESSSYAWKRQLQGHKLVASFDPCLLLHRSVSLAHTAPSTHPPALPPIARSSLTPVLPPPPPPHWPPLPQRSPHRALPAGQPPPAAAPPPLLL